jgi:hypothetical protein
MNKKVILLGAILTLLISACGAGQPPVPTTDPMSVVNTAQAAAYTAIAQTQAAIPTATFTEIPTQTPLPTDTPVPLPTLPPVTPPTATSASSANGDPCYHPIAANEGGPRSVLRFKNTTKGPIYVFVYIWKKNAFGECGYIGFDMSKNASTTVTSMPQGYFAITAWTNNKTKTAYGEAIISDDHLIDFEIYDDWIHVTYP